MGQAPDSLKESKTWRIAESSVTQAAERLVLGHNHCIERTTGLAGVGRRRHVVLRDNRRVVLVGIRAVALGLLGVVVGAVLLNRGIVAVASLILFGVVAAGRCAGLLDAGVEIAAALRLHGRIVGPHALEDAGIIAEATLYLPGVAGQALLFDNGGHLAVDIGCGAANLALLGAVAARRARLVNIGALVGAAGLILNSAVGRRVGILANLSRRVVNGILRLVRLASRASLGGIHGVAARRDVASAGLVLGCRVEVAALHKVGCTTAGSTGAGINLVNDCFVMRTRLVHP